MNINLIKHYRATLMQYNFHSPFSHYTRDYLDEPTVKDLEEFVEAVRQEDPAHKNFKFDIEVTTVYKAQKSPDI